MSVEDNIIDELNEGLQVVDSDGVVTLIKFGCGSLEQDLQVESCLLVQIFGIDQILDLIKNQVDFTLGAVGTVVAR